jgi:hypothetical protein
MSVLNKLTEGIVNRDLKKEGDALLSKWEKTGLLEGLTGDSSRNGMARLLENQAKQLLREASSMAAGDVEGFASVAFPLVRRVFGGLLANDLVSVQPMSLPSGLIFFLDFTYQGANLGVDAGDSVYGGGVVASAITGGVSDITEDGGGFYNLANAYSSPSGSVQLGVSDDDTDPANMGDTEIGLSGSVANQPFAGAGAAISALTDQQKKAIRWDPDVLSSTSALEVFQVLVKLTAAQMANINTRMLGACRLTVDIDGTTDNTHGLTMTAAGTGLKRRLTHLGYRSGTGGTGDIVADSELRYLSLYYVAAAGTAETTTDATWFLHFPVVDDFTNGGAIGSIVGQDTWGLEEPRPGTGTAGSVGGKNTIPEIDIKVDSVAVTAITKKLKAKWSPELGQDLNAYHNLDAEVELTSILSEQIALEIDREIVNDLIQGGTAGTYYWSRSPGLFVNRVTGAEIGATSAAPDFTGTVSEWYETLIETINDVSAQIHRKTLRGGANFLVTSPEVANILEFTSGFRASVTADADRGTVGAVKVGSMSKKWDVYVDPYFPRNLVLVGRKGGSFLESGYVYAPYVPLQVTPTIFGTEDFVPRKGVMTRYAKKMVRPDMYGLVVVRGLLGEAGG